MTVSDAVPGDIQRHADGTSDTTATAHGATERRCRVAPNEDTTQALAPSGSLTPYVPKTLLQGLDEAIGSPLAPESDTMSIRSLQIRTLETSHDRGTSPPFD